LGRKIYDRVVAEAPPRVPFYYNISIFFSSLSYSSRSPLTATDRTFRVVRYGGVTNREHK